MFSNSGRVVRGLPALVALATVWIGLAPPAPAADAAPAVVPAITPQAPAAPVADNYIIGPGDTIQVFVWRNPDLSVTVPVRPDGKISTPLAEDVVAIGKTPSQLAREMEKVLSEFVRTPQVNIIVSQAVSSYSKVTVVGQVKNPQSLPYREGLKVMDVVLASGGLTDFAAPNRAKVVRKAGKAELNLPVHLGDLMNKGAMKYNIDLKPGDVLIVPQSRF